MKTTHWLGFWLALFAGFGAHAQPLNVTTLGAKGDGKTLNTSSIQQAIDRVGAAGGGTVWIPAGTYLTGTLRLVSNLTLHLDNGAVLLGSPNMADYPTHKHLLYGENISNVSLTGHGTINGNGSQFFDANFVVKADRPTPFLLFRNARNLTIRDVSIINAPAHGLVLEHCDRAVIDGISIINDLRTPNTDGIDLTLSKNIRIANCYIETGDDAICLKAKADPLPNANTATAPPVVENIVVTNCIISSDDAALKLGTGSATVTRNCIFSNCILKNTRYGIALFMIDGGLYQNIQFDNLVIETGSRYRTEYPVFIDVDRRRQDSPLGKIDGIRFSNLTIRTRGNLLMAGQPNAVIENLSFDNIDLRLQQAVDLAGSRKPKGSKTIPIWPDSQDFSAQNAHITIANARNVRLRNVRISTDGQGTQRPDVFTQNVSGLVRDNKP